MTPRISSWPPRQFPFRTRLATGETVPITKSRFGPSLMCCQGALCTLGKAHELVRQEAPRSDSGLWIWVSDQHKDRYSEYETLIHEFVHLAEEEMLRDGVIRRRMSEKRVEAMGVHLTRYLVEARMLRGLPERISWDQPMLPFEEGDGDV